MLNENQRREYRERCSRQSDEIFKALEEQRENLSEDDYLSIAETAEYLENESVGKEGVDY